MTITPVGLSLRPERYDALTVEFIPAKYWSGENELYARKWWDYRIMHPMQATYHFAFAFNKAYQQAMTQRDDYERAQYITGLRHADFLDGAAATRTALWKARQAADALGCPYGYYCFNAMKDAQRRDRQNLPRPQALYSTAPMFDNDVSIVEFIRAKWQQRQKEELQYSHESFYRIDQFVRSPHQMEHQRMLLRHVRNRPGKSLLLAGLVYEARVLSEAVVSAAFEDGENLLRAARNYAL